MKKSVNTLRELMYIANGLGEVTSVNMFDPSFISIKGTTVEGEDFEFTFSIKEKK